MAMSQSNASSAAGASQNPLNAGSFPVGAGWLSAIKTRFSRFSSPSLRLLILVVMLTVSVVPVSLFYKWVEQSTFKQEIAYVDENHLIIAKNLSAALSRYVVDMKSVFSLVVQNEENFGVYTKFQTALINYNLCHISIIDEQDKLLGQINGMMQHAMEIPDPNLLIYLRDLAASANGEIAVSGIRTHAGQPHFFVVQQLPSGNIAVAPWDPKYIIELQKSIAFGDRGHSMVVDQDGLVVAHPNAKWQEISKDASKLSVVKAMMAGETGVMQFFSPPMQADMIAGYTSVPETGWGVMVPQPLSELADRARETQAGALVFATLEMLLIATISLWLSRVLSRPIQAISDTARKVSRGDLEAHVGELSGYTPNEIQRLAVNFDHMVDDLAKKTETLRRTLEKAEEISAERAQLLKLANQANEVKSQFVSMVSHELRTPLTSIKGSLELLESGALGELNGDVKGMVAIAVKNSTRLAMMIDDLLDLERLDAGKMRYDFVNVTLADLIAESIEANKSYGVLNDVTLRALDIDHSATVKGDYNRLMQVMANLLSNAAKFSNPGGTVDVTLELTDKNAKILVRDQGIGIPGSAKDKVFEKFVQLDSSDSRQVGGSGLGLGIAKMIVEKHGGQIGYSSETGQGSTFYFELPLVG